MKLPSRQTIVAIALVILANEASAQAPQEIAVPLSDSSRPAVLEVSAMSGSVTVTGYDGDQVLIASLGGPERIEAADEVVNAEGLRRIPNTSFGFSAEESDNTVSVRMSSATDGGGVSVSVPRRTSVKVRTIDDGDIIVEGVTGEHELSAVDGSITATDISGSVVANTTDGDVVVSLLELTPAKAMSFTSFDGNVEVDLPANLAADFRISTNEGEVLTDFDVEIQPREPIVERSQDGGRYQVRLEREVRAAVGGGGPEMRFRTFEGDIVIRSR